MILPKLVCMPKPTIDAQALKCAYIILLKVDQARKEHVAVGHVSHVASRSTEIARDAKFPPIEKSKI